VSAAAARASIARKAFAWFVHFFTALGLVCAAGMAVLIVAGDDRSLRWAFALMVVATGIDATDGWLARRARVKEVLPDFDGSLLDNIIDFHTYTSLPLLLLWRAGIPGGALASVLLLPLLASAYGFSKTDAKTEDGFFLGFPSYWNIVALYLYTLRPPAVGATVALLVLALMTFVRTPYLYTSRGGPFARTINIGAVLYSLVLGGALLGPAPRLRPLMLLSLAYPALYIVLSASVAFRTAGRSTTR
jgi:phosphatidylcholine synthase